ncbi:hypothetical protein NHX12_003156 [Muraenolepis orangiensis]|uniref:Synembryn n=1 Tax=Muraenolepis orangiensis TaxID=630683 RepID=A0A9Q0IFG4_9TELE|nr:hypothetical protein NHX12_003156 [Muraenolepis orangiensis]
MDLNTVLSRLETGSEEDIEKVLRQFNQENSHTFTFDQNEENLRSKVCQSLVTALETLVQPCCQRASLEALRILSRDRRALGPVATREGVLVLAGLAQLHTDRADGLQDDTLTSEQERVVVEALKCLCNVVYNSPAAQQVGADVKLAQSLCAHLHAARAGRHEVGLFSLRLLFLLTALRPDVRGGLQTEVNAVRLLTEVLERTLHVSWVGPYEAAAPEPGASPISVEDNERVMEALKALFNLTLTATGEEEGQQQQFRQMVGILRHLLVLRTETEETSEEAHSHAVNLLSNLPAACLDVLVEVPVQGGQAQYQGNNMEAIQVLLEFLEKRIDKGSNYKEALTPVLSLLTEGSRSHRHIRRYIKTQVLPPLTEAKVRPEIGNTVRNKLVRLMTHVDMGVKQGAAEFLFVLCKESVDNLLKYTGYGNAAGHLVAKGLLAGGRGETKYSEDEDSDTEQYKNIKPLINPITGHVEEPMPNPMADMTEEQKEYEAQKMVIMLDELIRKGVIQPMGVRKGTLAPLEGILRQHTHESSGSDTD